MKVLDLERPGVHGGARAGIAYRAAPYLQRPAVSSHARLFVGARGGFVRGRDVNGSSLSTPDATRRPLEPSRPADEVGKWPEDQTERPVQTLPHGQRVC